MQSDVERIRRSPGDGPLGSSGLAVMLDNFRRSFDEETPEDKTMREVTTVPSTSEEDPNGNRRDVAGFSRINIPSYDGSVTQQVRDREGAVDLEISRIASPAGSTRPRFESVQFEELVAANKKLREELQLAMDMQVKYEAFVKEVMFRKESELVETKQEISVLREENKKMFEEMMQRFRLNESGAVQYLPIKEPRGADATCKQNNTSMSNDMSSQHVKQQSSLVKFHSKDISRFNGEMTLEYSVASWFGELEFQFQRQRIPPGQKVDIAATLVGNRVRNWLQTLRGEDRLISTQGTWESFKSLLVKEYLSLSHLQYILGEIQRTIQGSEEKTSDFVNRFSALANHFIACCMVLFHGQGQVETACTRFGLERYFAQNLFNEVTASFVMKLLIDLEKQNVNKTLSIGSLLPALYREAKSMDLTTDAYRNDRSTHHEVSYDDESAEDTDEDSQHSSSTQDEEDLR
ncbi:hypothetical protein GUITHDRAFT_156684, partial [Guillardia theta CCMP2712]